jgi:hypothetical protein
MRQGLLGAARSGPSGAAVTEGVVTVQSTHLSRTHERAEQMAARTDSRHSTIAVLATARIRPVDADLNLQSPASLRALDGALDRERDMDRADLISFGASLGHTLLGQMVKGGDSSLQLPCVPQKPENADSDACKDAARKYDVRVNSYYHVQDARAKDQPEHDPLSVRRSSSDLRSPLWRMRHLVF